MIALADLKTLLGVTGTSEDASLTLLEAGAVLFVQRYTGRYFGPVTELVEYPQASEGILWLRAEPRLDEYGEPESLVIDRRSSIGGDWEAVEETEYELDGREVHMSYWYWPRGPRFVRVEYSAGYADDEVPADIKLAVVALIARARRALISGTGDKKSETIGGYSYTLADAADAPVPGAQGLTALAILNTYRRIPV